MINEKICTGCNACKYVCSQKCINIELSNTGFYKAKINRNSCTQCNLCEKVCHLYYTNIFNKPSKMIVAKSRNIVEIENSSSGGIAYEISVWGIKNNYSIIAVEYEFLTNTAKYGLVDDVNDLKKFSGSKYIQANSENILELILSSHKAMIFGLPCQIAGIKKLIKIKKLDKDIIYIDLLCHGIPSYNLWNKYLNYIKENHNICFPLKKVNFRYKTDDISKYVIKIQDAENKLYLNDNCKDRGIFSKIFFSDYLLNEQCYDCQYRGTNSMADIRIGDFLKNKDDRLSTIIAFTDIGEQIVNEIDIDFYHDDQFLFGQILKNVKKNKILRILITKAFQSSRSIISIYNIEFFPYKLKSVILRKIKK